MSRSLSSMGSGSKDDLTGALAAHSGFRGGNGDDIIYGSDGDTEIDGRRGWDTVIYAGSIFDYGLRYDDQGLLVVEDRVGNGGTDTLTSIEQLQFDDYDFVRGGDNPAVLSIAPIVAIAGGTATFTTTYFDPDDTGNGIIMSSSTLTSFSEISRTTQTVLDGEITTVTWEIDLVGSATRARLALGETLVETVSYLYRDGLDGFQGWRRAEIDITVVGVNDAPVLRNGAALQAFEDRGQVRIDLAPFAGDIDSDDTAESLSVRIVSADPRLNLTVEGGTIVFDPGSDFQYLSSDDVLVFDIQIQMVDRHGATSDVRTVQLTVIGQQDALPILWAEAGRINFAAAGIDFADAEGPFLGSTYMTQAERDALFDFDDADNSFAFDGWIFSGFSEGFYGRTPEGDTIRVNAQIYFGAGNDTAGFTFSSSDQYDGRVYFSENDLYFEEGEDVLAIEMISDGGATFASNEIWMGSGDDQFLLDINAMGSIIMFGNDVYMGGGDDYVRIRASSPGTNGDFIGSVTSSERYYLGNGQDTFIFEVDLDNPVIASFDGRLMAGFGADHVRLDNRGSDGVATPDLPQRDTGFYGTVDMGSGDDVLEFYLLARADENADGVLDGGDGLDTLYLGFNAEDASITVVNEEYGRYTIETAGQRLEIYRFEKIVFADGVLMDDLAIA